MSTLSWDEKWDLVKAHYESSYKIKFKEKPSMDDIQMLWNKLQRLKMDSDYYYRIKDMKAITSSKE